MKVQTKPFKYDAFTESGTPGNLNHHAGRVSAFMRIAGYLVSARHPGCCDSADLPSADRREMIAEEFRRTRVTEVRIEIYWRAAKRNIGQRYDQIRQPAECDPRCTADVRSAKYRFTRCIVDRGSAPSRRSPTTSAKLGRYCIPETGMVGRWDAKAGLFYLLPFSSRQGVVDEFYQRWDELLLWCELFREIRRR